MGIDQTLSQNNKGRVEVYYNNDWGTICNKGWTDKSAKVACKMLNYENG